jgi:hypothetical protein
VDGPEHFSDATSSGKQLQLPLQQHVHWPHCVFHHPHSQALLVGCLLVKANGLQQCPSALFRLITVCWGDVLIFLAATDCVRSIRTWYGVSLLAL